VCGIYCHTKCVDRLGGSCSGNQTGHIREEPSTETGKRIPAERLDRVHDIDIFSVAFTGPSLFGRDLTEQVIEDGHTVPVIVTKCIEAVETQGSFLNPQALIDLTSHTSLNSCLDRDGIRGYLPENRRIVPFESHYAAIRARKL